MEQVERVGHMGKRQTIDIHVISDLIDTSSIPTSQVASTLMTALKGRPNVYGYIVSGYPRSLRDVAVYLSQVCTLCVSHMSGMVLC